MISSMENSAGTRIWNNITNTAEPIKVATTRYLIRRKVSLNSSCVRDMTTMLIHKGFFKWKAMPISIASARPTDIRRIRLFRLLLSKPVLSGCVHFCRSLFLPHQMTVAAQTITEPISRLSIRRGIRSRVRALPAKKIKQSRKQIKGFN